MLTTDGVDGREGTWRFSRRGTGCATATVVVHLELGSAEAARAFAGDPRRRDALERAGVETADDLVLEEIEAR